MMGDNRHQTGLIPLLINDLYAKIDENMATKDFLVKLIYVEVYNEAIRDLLNPSEKILDLREDPQKGTLVAGATEEMVSSLEQILDILRIGSMRRTVDATAANEASSRSHAVLQITVE